MTPIRYYRPGPGVTVARSGKVVTITVRHESDASRRWAQAILGRGSEHVGTLHHGDRGDPLTFNEISTLKANEWLVSEDGDLMRVAALRERAGKWGYDD